MNKAGLAHAGDRMVGKDDALVYRDGHRVRFLKEGRDERGDYLLIEHVWTRPGMMAGPHWHPVLTETFRVLEGRMRFRVDGREFFLGPGEKVTVCPGEVHRFWNTGEERLRVVHEVRPPGHHRRMFELWHRLDLVGKTNRQGVPKDPLALGLLWELQDGYLAGVPVSLQKIFFGGLARLARITGYRGNRFGTRREGSALAKKGQPPGRGAQARRSGDRPRASALDPGPQEQQDAYDARKPDGGGRPTIHRRRVRRDRLGEECEDGGMGVDE